MSPIGDAVAALKKAADGNAAKRNLKDVVDNVSSCLVLLNSSRPSFSAMEKLRSVFRVPFQELYDAYFSPTLQLSSAVLSTILEEKLSDAYIHGESVLPVEWDKAACALLSGVLDFLEDNARNDHGFKAAVGKFLYPILCRFFFQTQSKVAPQLSVQLCTFAYTVLSDAAYGHSDNQTILRDKAVMGPVRLGAAISNSQDYLITEALLALLARLLATENTISSRSERTKFVQEALGSSKFFKCSKELVAILQEVSTSDWDVAATRLIDALSQSDIKYPQPFSIDEINACGRVFPQPNPSDRLILDRRGFLANVILTREDLYESLDVSYSDLRTVTIDTSKTTANNVLVLITLSNAPRVGNVALEITEKELYLKFLLRRKDLDRFMETLRRRGVGKLNFVCSAQKSSRRTISIASGVNFTSNSSLLEPRPDFEEKVKRVQEVYKTDVEEQTSDPVVLLVPEAAPLALLPDDDPLARPTAFSRFTTRDDEQSVNIVYSDQQGAPTLPLIKEIASPDNLEHPQVSGEGALNIPQTKARRPSRGRKCRKAGTPDSRNPKAAAVRPTTRRKQLLDSAKVSITDVSKPAEDHCEGQSMGAIALLDEGLPISSNSLFNARVSDIDASALGLVEDKERSYPASLSTNTNDRTTNESEIHGFEVPRVSHSGTEQSEETKHLIAYPDSNEVDVNAKIDGQLRRSQTPAEDIRVMTNLGKRRTRQTGRAAGNTIARNLEEENGPRKLRKTTDDDIQAGESASGWQSKVTMLTLSGCATNETAPPNAFDEIADQSKEKRFGKHKITKTKPTSVTVKKGTHTASVQGKPKPKPRLVTSAKHRDPVPPEETTRVVLANHPPPITNEPVTTADVHDSIPTSTAQTQTTDSVQLHDAGTDKVSKGYLEILKQGHVSPPSDSNNPFTAIDVQHKELSYNAGDLLLHPRGPTCPGEVPLDEAVPFGLGLGQSDTTLTSLMDEFIDSQALTACLVPMKVSDDVNEFSSKPLINQSPEPEQKKVITNGLPACRSPDLRKSVERNILPDKVDVATAAIINDAPKPPTFPSALPRKRLSVTFASPIERVMSPSTHSSVNNTQDRMDHSPIEMRLQQRRARQGSWNLDGKRPSSSYDDPLSPLLEPTTSTTPRKMTRPLFPSNSSNYMRKDEASSKVPTRYEAAMDEVDIQDIVDVLNDIQAMIIEGIANKFANMRKEVRACREELLQEVLCDLQLLVTTNSRHFNNLVHLEEEYHEYHKTMSFNWEDLISCNDDILSHFKDSLREHDRTLSAKTLPTFILPQRPLFISRSSVDI